MKTELNFSKVFESNIRIKMLASLYQSSLTYRELKEICCCSDGNMATHMKKLMKEEFVVEKKEFVNRKPSTTYFITKKGRKEFKNYVYQLNQLLEKGEECEKEDYIFDSAIVNV